MVCCISAARHRRNDFDFIAWLQELFGIARLGHEAGVDCYCKRGARSNRRNGIGHGSSFGKGVGKAVDEDVHGVTSGAALAWVAVCTMCRPRRSASGDAPVCSHSRVASSTAGAIM